MGMYDFLDKIGLKAVLEAVKGKMPTSLPANGGNADTLDNLHADEFAKSTNPIINGDMIFKRDSSQQTVSAVYSASDMLILRNANKDNLSFRCDVVISVDGVRIVTDTQNFKIGDGGNADTVDGLHANDLITGGTRNQRNTIDDCTIAGTYAVSPMYTTDMPTQYGMWGICDVRVYGLGIFQTIKYTDTAIVICRSKIVSQTEWTDWKEISTTPIKSTGLITSPTDEYGTIILPNSDTRRYLSIAAVGCYAEMLLFDDKYAVHIMNGDYKK